MTLIMVNTETNRKSISLGPVYRATDIYLTTDSVGGGGSLYTP